MSGDVVEAAKRVLDNVTEGPWLYVPGGDEEASVVSEGERSPDAVTVGGVTFHPGFSVAVDLRNGDAKFIAEAHSLIPELVAEVERLRAEKDSIVRVVAERYNQVEDSMLSAETAAETARHANEMAGLKFAFDALRGES